MNNPAAMIAAAAIVPMEMPALALGLSPPPPESSSTGSLSPPSEFADPPLAVPVDALSVAVLLFVEVKKVVVTNRLFVADTEDVLKPSVYGMDVLPVLVLDGKTELEMVSVVDERAVLWPPPPIRESDAVLLVRDKVSVGDGKLGVCEVGAAVSA